MRFFVSSVERPVHDPQEESAMLQYRIASCDYLKEQLDAGSLAYAFKANNGARTIMMVEADDTADADRVIKRDPLASYSECEVLPTVSTRIMAEEIQGYLNEEILSDTELRQLDPRSFTIEPTAKYFMAQKMLRAMSPLLPECEEREIHRRTLRSQRLHHSDIELTDDNTVGRPWGLLILKADTADQVRAHVARAEIYPDTVVDIVALLTVQQARELAERRLRELRRPIDVTRRGVLQASGV